MGCLLCDYYYVVRLRVYVCCLMNVIVLGFICLGGWVLCRLVGWFRFGVLYWLVGFGIGCLVFCFIV